MDGGRLTGAGTGQGNTPSGHQNTKNNLQKGGLTPLEPETGAKRTEQSGSEYLAQTKEVGPGESLELPAAAGANNQITPNNTNGYELD